MNPWRKLLRRILEFFTSINWKKNYLLILIELSQKKDRLEREYETVLSYAKEDSLETKAYEKALYEAKLALDSHPLVQEYNSLYVPIRDLYMQMDDILFGPFRSKTLSHEAK